MAAAVVAVAAVRKISSKIAKFHLQIVENRLKFQSKNLPATRAAVLAQGAGALSERRAQQVQGATAAALNPTAELQAGVPGDPDLFARFRPYLPVNERKRGKRGETGNRGGQQGWAAEVGKE